MTRHGRDVRVRGRSFCAAVLASCLSLAGCDTSGPPDYDVAVDAQAELRADTVVFGVRLTNRSDAPVAASYGDCGEELGALLQVRDPAGMRLRWSYLEWRRPQGCYPISYPITLQPDEKRLISRRIPVAMILGDSLPPGPYHLSVAPAVSTEALMPAQFQPLGLYDLVR